MKGQELTAMIIIESWLSKEEDINEIKMRLPSYNVFRTTLSSYEGVLILVNMLARARPVFSVGGWLLGINVRTEIKECLLVGVYLKPLEAATRIPVLLAFVQQYAIAGASGRRFLEICIFGDFNGCLRAGDLNEYQRLGCEIIDMGVTRDASLARLDFFITNVKHRHENTIVPMYSRSDHRCCILNLELAGIGKLPVVPVFWNRKAIIRDMVMNFAQWEWGKPFVSSKDSRYRYKAKKSLQGEAVRNQGEDFFRQLLLSTGARQSLRGAKELFRWFKNRNVQFQKGKGVIGIESSDGKITPIQQAEREVANYLEGLYRGDKPKLRKHKPLIDPHNSEDKKELRQVIYNAIYTVGKSHKAIGPDGFPPEVIHIPADNHFNRYERYMGKLYTEESVYDVECIERVQDFKGLIFECIQDEFPPEIVLETRIHLLAKKECVTKLEDVRTIAISSPILKVIERTLLYYLQPAWDIVTKSQIGFRHKMGTIPGTIRLLDMIRLRRKGQTIFFLDLKKAFDTVRWSRLEVCLEQFGFASNLIQMVMYIVENVTMKYGETIAVRGKGCPQGCVLSPLLFDIYIDYLAKELLRIGNVILFADDIAGMIDDSNSTRLLDILASAEAEFGLVLNPSKSNYLACRGCKNQILDRAGIRATTSYRHLGLWVQTTVRKTGAQYAKDIRKKMMQIKKCSSRLPNRLKELAMNAWVTGPSHAYLPALLLLEGLNIDEVEIIFASAYRFCRGLPTWASRQEVLEFFVRRRDWYNYAFKCLCKVDQIEESLELFCHDKWPENWYKKDYLEERKEPNIIREAINCFINATKISGFSVYLGLSKMNWKGTLGKQFYSLWCRQHNKPWCQNHAIVHKLIPEGYCKSHIITSFLLSLNKMYKTERYSWLMTALMEWQKVYNNINVIQECRRRERTEPNVE
jgi:hypothetical protein